jgi:hypothetical protein
MCVDYTRNPSLELRDSIHLCLFIVKSPRHYFIKVKFTQMIYKQYSFVLKKNLVLWVKQFMMCTETLANVSAGFLAVFLRNLDILIYLMFVPCIIRRSRNNQHNAQICTNALLYILAATCFGSSLPSSGSV